MRIDNKKKEESCYRIYQTIREDPSILETAISRRNHFHMEKFHQFPGDQKSGPYIID